MIIDLMKFWQFQATYGKPLLAARDPKCSAKDAEAGVLAMEALHKQVMLFSLLFSLFPFPLLGGSRGMYLVGVLQIL